MSSLCILAHDQQASANLEKCMGSPSFIDREEQDTNAVVDKWSPLHSVWSENITKCTRSSNTGVYIFKLPAILMFFMMLAHVWVEVNR